MTVTTAPSTRSRVRPRVRVGQVILTALFALCALIAMSTAFAPDPFEPAAVVLISSFGVLAGVLGVAAVWAAARSRVVQLAMWALPLFFVWHVAALGTWLPDAVFAVLSGIGCALLWGAERRPG